ncbi:manganese efflux pump MntP family protein [Sulfurospirillum barnesii]|uniref:Putative manganese efflux pump MntP n=1 Tax=Sulfurospirillum barnesii (strain ATCC 700032 / DSM 10660 / SES-3) TaxID=760154 RepID=I3XVF5_SULBS|nr:manganese efflux pump MntP family protein [Sulfurospirillum barnesii]AFL67929.1 putative membrane protein [Sulfurospirillum barnesii SES-3]
MIEVLLLAFALSMDAFAVSIGLGSKRLEGHKLLALKAGLFFGIFQAIMPLIGYLGGHGLLGFVSEYAHYIAFGLLLLIGAKMIYEGVNEGIEEGITKITNKLMLTLAIATSIDAMAAGFSLTLLDFNPFVACFLIGLTTCVISICGIYVGRLTGTWLEGKAEVFGGVVLVAIGFRILFF